MNVTELGKALAAIGIPDRLLAIGGQAEYSWCVELSADDMWEVYWYERGNKHGLVRLATESDACYQLLGRLAYSQLLSGTLAVREAFNSRPSPEPSPALVEWARAAGYAMTRGDHSRATVLWSDPGGETRFYIRHRFDGAYVLTSSQRASVEYFELATTALETLERHLFGLFGSSSRYAKRSAFLRLSTDPRAVAADFGITHNDADGFFRLTNEEGRTIASARNEYKLVELSYLLTHPLADIIASYEDPEGRPLFRV